MQVSAEQAWAWATSAAGINAELWPFLKMSAPAKFSKLDGSAITLGRPIFRSWILLFGVLPIDRSDLTVVEMEEGRRFVERSPMRSMRLWQHERIIEPDGVGAVRVTDHLTFEPRLAGRLVAWFVDRLFRNRHRVLIERLSVRAADN